VTGDLVIMGSRETAPTMVEAHREVLRAAGAGPALLVDTLAGGDPTAPTLGRPHTWPEVAGGVCGPGALCAVVHPPSPSTGIHPRDRAGGHLRQQVLPASGTRYSAAAQLPSSSWR
jgi:hypothetical protein